MTGRRANTSRHAILGVLSFCPMSGYDVKKLIERSIAHFWSESYGQIYPILKRLAAEGLAERRQETQRGKPDRHVYSLTAKGREELARWLAVPARSEPARSELLLKLFLGGAGRPADSLAQVEHFEARQRELLATYDGIERQLRKEMAGHPQLPFSLITLHYGQRRCRTALAWCEETRATLRHLRPRAVRRARRR
jgi:DNA-binding PadR family transcriptional regulator